jgi:hypothetical protein
MGRVHKSLTEAAREVFADLGYTVTPDGDEFRAVRDWKDVRVVPVEEGASVPTDGDSWRCFVTWQDRCEHLLRSLEAAAPEAPWAVVSVSPAGDHEVVRRPGTPV